MIPQQQPNPRLQRPRSAPLRSPLSRKPLGDTRPSSQMGIDMVKLVAQRCEQALGTVTLVAAVAVFVELRGFRRDLSPIRDWTASLWTMLSASLPLALSYFALVGAAAAGSVSVIFQARDTRVWLWLARVAFCLLSLVALWQVHRLCRWLVLSAHGGL